MDKTYKTEDITITWQPEICSHSAICFKGLPEVFNPREKPWIKQNNSTTENIIEQINKCPSGAISYKLNQINTNIKTMEATKIKCAENGPLLVEGTITIVDKDGIETSKEGMTALCRCGHSKNKPFCDGGHKASDFKS